MKEGAKIYNKWFENQQDGEGTVPGNRHNKTDQPCLFRHAKCSRDGTMCKHPRGCHEYV